ncbi:MAG: AI-2E family transporter [Bacteroidia bacterium]|nr:AI-2E family transporter [Bacteroidia bacterium]
MNRIRQYTQVFIFIILGLVVLGLIGVVLWYLRDIMTYLIAAAVIALIGRPILRLLGKVKIRNRSLPAGLNAGITLGIIYGFGLGLFLLFIPPLVKQTEKLENVQMEAISHSLEAPIAAIDKFTQTYQLIDNGMSVEEYFISKVKTVLTSARISNIANSLVGFTGDLLIGFFAVSFIAFFFLKQRTLMHWMVMVFIPPDYKEKVNDILVSIKTLLTRYFIGVVVEVLLVGALITLGLTILGVENAVLIGFFGGIFNVIPYLGPLIGGVMGVGMTILGSLNLDFYDEMVPLIIGVTIVFSVVQMVDNFIIQPMIYSNSVKAHPLEIFLVILLAGNLAGVVGMIVAIPVYTILRVIAKEFFNQFELVRTITKDMGEI